MNLMMLTTLVVYFCVNAIAKKLKSPLFNSLVVSVLLLIAICLLTETTYTMYREDVHLINQMLPYSVVALAYPLYELSPKIRSQWRALFSITLIASLCAMISGITVVLLLGGDERIAASILPKSVTTAIAVTISEEQHSTTQAIPSITAFCVIVAGLFGSLFGYPILRLLNIRHTEARGLAMGSVSHALGTAKALEVHLNDGAFSSLALVLCGIFTAVLAPFIFPIYVWLLHSLGWFVS